MHQMNGKKIFININFILFLIICFIGLFLRLYQINFEDYWFDDNGSLRAFTRATR
mgnify:CR=1 FL=1